MEQNTKTISDYIDVIRRRSHYALTVFLGICLVSAIVAYCLPRVYRSTATMLMEAPLQRNLIQSALAEYEEAQIRLITQKVMTTDNALALIQSNKLYGIGALNGSTKYELADRFKHDTEIAMVKSDFGGNSNSGVADRAFTISFNYEEPEKAQQIAAELAHQFVDKNDRLRAQRASRATDFLAGESQKLDREIHDLDARIADYKKQYKDSLPEQLQGNLSTLEIKSNELRYLDQQIRSTRERIVFLGTELARAQVETPANVVNNKAPLSKADEIKLLRAQYLQLSSKYYPTHPDVIRIRHQIEALDPLFQQSASAADIRTELQTATKSLRYLEKKYAPDHPDIIKLQDQIGKLREQLENTNLPSGQESSTMPHTTNPVYLGVEAQYKSSQVELESLLRSKELLNSQSEALQTRIALVPEVEKGYLELVRERDRTLGKFNQLKEKLVDAKLMQTLEEEQHGQTLTIIEQPIVPTHPEKAIRRKIVLGGFFIALAAGIGMAFLVEFMDPGIRGYRALWKTTGLMPLAVIPYIESPAEVESRLLLERRHKQTLVWTILACIGLAVIAISIPLVYDPTWENRLLPRYFALQDAIPAFFGEKQ